MSEANWQSISKEDRNRRDMVWWELKVIAETVKEKAVLFRSEYDQES